MRLHRDKTLRSKAFLAALPGTPKIPKKSAITYLLDFFDKCSWPSCIFLMCFLYMVTFMIFGCCYLAIEAGYHVFSNITQAPEIGNDLSLGNNTHDSSELHTHDFESGGKHNAEFGEHCVTGVTNRNYYLGFFQFSFETQTTIGYGIRYVKLTCYPAVFISWIQTIFVTVIMSPILGGLIFRKLLKPVEDQTNDSNKKILDNLKGRISHMNRHLVDFSHLQQQKEKEHACSSASLASKSEIEKMCQSIYNLDRKLSNLTQSGGSSSYEDQAVPVENRRSIGGLKNIFKMWQGETNRPKSGSQPNDEPKIINETMQGKIRPNLEKFCPPQLSVRSSASSGLRNASMANLPVTAGIITNHNPINYVINENEVANFTYNPDFASHSRACTRKTVACDINAANYDSCSISTKLSKMMKVRRSETRACRKKIENKSYYKIKSRTSFG